MKKWIVIALFVFLCPTMSFSLEKEDNAVFTKVIDSGAGLACVTSAPGGFYMVYDAGHWFGKKQTMDGIASVVPDGEEIDLMVLSHGDSDHMAAVPLILEKYKVNMIIRSGLERTSKTWEKADQSIKLAKQAGTRVINLKTESIPVGGTWIYDDTFITFVTGFYAPPDEWGFSDKKSGEFLNAGSIVIRLTYHGKSILFCGDAVGRHIGDPPEALIGTEKFMVDNSDVIKIDSNVLIAPHHGADNGNSKAFIEKVSPEYVIFSAGHDYGHPRQATAERYLNYGVDITKMFRTDLGDDEGEDEWDYGRVQGQKDPRGDDGIDILIRGNGDVVVEYSGE